MPELPSLFLQSVSGRDHAPGDPAALQMANLSYLLGDRQAGECLLVDPSWDPLGLAQRARAEGLRVRGALLTHYHGDHAGGPLWGAQVKGIPELLAAGLGPVWIHEADLPLLADRCKLRPGQAVGLREGERLALGALGIEVLHTPGHSPGSACFRVLDALLTGDTLFLDGCGRVDLPTSNPADMQRSLARLKALPDQLEVYPGHDYGGLHASLGALKKDNAVFELW